MYRNNISTNEYQTTGMVDNATLRAFVTTVTALEPTVNTKLLKVARSMNRTRLTHLDCDFENDTVLLQGFYILTGLHMYIPDEELHVFHFVTIGVMLVLIIFAGSVLNIISVIVLAHDKRYNASVYLLQVLASVDTFYLAINFFHYYLPVLVIKLVGMSCDLNFYLRFFAGHAYPWFNAIVQSSRTLEVGMLVIMTIERYIVIFYPLKAAKFCTFKAARIQVSILCLYSITWLTVFRILSLSTIKIPLIMKQIPLALNSIINLIVPVLVVFILTFKICRSLNLANRARREMRNGTEAYGPRTRQGNVTLRLISIACAFLIFVVPSIIIGLDFLVSNFCRYSPFSHLQRDVMNIVAVSCMNTNSAINFVLYFVTGRKFRRNLKRTFCRCLRKRKSARDEFNSYCMTNTKLEYNYDSDETSHMV